MKRFLLLVLFVLLCQPVFAANKTATFGDQNSLKAYRLTATNDGVLTYAQDTGLVMPYLNTATTNTTLLATQSGTVLIFGNGAGAAVNGTTYTLPAATVGLQFTFVSDVAKYFRLAPNGTDVFNFSTATTNSKLSNSGSALAGDSITIFCGNTGKWSVMDKVGTWAVDNT